MATERALPTKFQINFVLKTFFIEQKNKYKIFDEIIISRKLSIKDLDIIIKPLKWGMFSNKVILKIEKKLIKRNFTKISIFKNLK